MRTGGVVKFEERGCQGGGRGSCDVDDLGEMEFGGEGVDWRSGEEAEAEEARQRGSEAEWRCM